jgi:hypothetical protein
MGERPGVPRWRTGLRDRMCQVEIWDRGVSASDNQEGDPILTPIERVADVGLGCTRIGRAPLPSTRRSSNAWTPELRGACAGRRPWRWRECAAVGRFGRDCCSVEPNTNAGRPSGTDSARNCALSRHRESGHVPGVGSPVVVGAAVRAAAVPWIAWSLPGYRYGPGSRFRAGSTRDMAKN